ncbi:MAG: hypothetical protein PGN09_05440 [Sphingomonas fennica]
MPRPDADFAHLHDIAIAGDEWVIEGNYSALLPQRLARATGLILLDVPAAISLFRYVRRCGRDSVKWAMIRHILVTTPGNRAAYARLFERRAVPAIRLGSPRAIAAFAETLAAPPVVAVETSRIAP